MLGSGFSFGIVRMATSLTLLRADQPPVASRADEVAVIARAYLYAELDAEQRRRAEHILFAALDDPSPLVRRTLAEVVAGASQAPHSLVLALADDQSSIAAVVLSRSPVLTDAEMIDCAAVSDAVAQAAIASRPALSASVSAALAEIGAVEALETLARNPGASIPLFSLQRMVERHGGHAPLREALLSRPNLPATVRYDLVVAVSRSLAAFVSENNWMRPEKLKKVTVEARDRAVVTIAQGLREEPSEAARALAAHLRAAGQVTTGLVLRLVLSGRFDLFRAILCDLADMPTGRVALLVRDSGGAGFAALYRRTGMADSLLPVFRSAIRAVMSAGEQSPGLSRRVIERVIQDCSAGNDGELDKLLVLLRRLEAEAAREEVRFEDGAAPRLLTEGPSEPPLLLADLDDAPQVPRVGRLDRFHLSGAVEDLVAA